MLTTEEAFLQLITTPSGRELAHGCYYDCDIVAACARFSAGDEWAAVAEIITRHRPAGRRALDLGAGNGIASYALAKLGFTVTAVEPDPSTLVGYGALLQMVEKTALPITHVAAFGENLPLSDHSFDLVYCRQVLHHAQDLPRMLAEVARLLVPGGVLVATREHVVDDQESLQAFLSQHPLHRLTGGEGAFTLDQYLDAMKTAGLSVRQVWGPWDSVINTYPMTENMRRAAIRDCARPKWRRLSPLIVMVPRWRRRYLKHMTKSDRTPGRFYSFLCVVNDHG